MNGTTLDLRTAFLGAPNSRALVWLDPTDGCLYLTIALSYDDRNDRQHLVRLVPTDAAGREVPFRCTLTPGLLTAVSDAGALRFAFQEADLLRVTGEGMGLRCDFKPSESTLESCCDSDDGTVEAMLWLTGKLRFVPLTGALHNSAVWDVVMGGMEDYDISILPENGTVELAIHQYYSNGQRADAYPAFDDCAAAQRQQFAAFCAEHAVPEAPAAIQAAWTLWTNQTMTGWKRDLWGFVSDKVTATAAVGWQQALAALALAPAKGAALLSGYLARADRGAVPCSVADIQTDWHCACPPLFGCLFDRLGAAPDAQLLADNTAWWCGRWRGAPNAPAWFCPNDPGLSPQDGDWVQFPLQTADLLACLLLQARLCRTACPDEAARWQQAEDALHAALLELWDGEGFVTRSLATGERRRDNSFRRLLALLADLPQPMEAALRQQLTAAIEAGLPADALPAAALLLPRVPALRQPLLDACAGLRGTAAAAITLLCLKS